MIVLPDSANLRWRSLVILTWLVGSVILHGAFPLTALEIENMCDQPILDQIAPEGISVALGGPDPYTQNVVFLGDGFSKDHLEFYGSAVKSIIEEIKQTYPLGSLVDAFTFYQVDVVSEEDGIDIPEECWDEDFDEEIAYRDNTLQTRHCGELKNGVNEFLLIESEDPTLVNKFADCPFLDQNEHPGFANQIIVLVNSPYFGGSGLWHGENGGIAYLSLASNDGGAPTEYSPYDEAQDNEENRKTIWATAIHEIGHSIFHLADEYCRQAGKNLCVSDTELLGETASNGEETMSLTEQATAILYDDTAGGSEPVARNITRHTERPLLKDKNPVWEHLIAGNDDPIQFHPLKACQEGGEPELQEDKGVGLYEGAGRRSCGHYRPAARCKMNQHVKVGFCPVCRDEILWRLSFHVPDRVYVLLDQLVVITPAFSADDIYDICLTITTASESHTTCEPLEEDELVETDDSFLLRALGFEGPDLTNIGVGSSILLDLEFRDAGEGSLVTQSFEFPAELGTHEALLDGYRVRVSFTSPFLYGWQDYVE